MSKGTKNQRSQKWWQKLFKHADKVIDKDDAPNKPEVNPLADVTIDQLKVEVIDADELAMPDIEIAFINPTTGELEVVNLPQDTFKIKVEEHESDDETVVLLELELPPRPEMDDEDPTKRITHFPPNSRLH